MKRHLLLVLLCGVLYSCQDENKIRLIEQQKEAQKSEAVFKAINRGWQFSIRQTDPTVQGKINNWMEWRSFCNEIGQKPKSTLGAFQKKAAVLAKRATDLKENIPYEFRNKAVISRISVIETRVKTLDLYIHLNPIPDQKVIQLVREIAVEIGSLQLQLEEIVRRSQIPQEIGEPDRIRMKDTSRALPTIPKQIPQPWVYKTY